MIDADQLLTEVRERRAEHGDTIPAPRAEQAAALAALIAQKRAG